VYLYDMRMLRWFGVERHDSISWVLPTPLFSEWEFAILIEKSKISPTPSNYGERRC
jgi:hypothetical protein